jgi:hypothetical protein
MTESWAALILRTRGLEYEQDIGGNHEYLPRSCVKAFPDRLCSGSNLVVTGLDLYSNSWVQQLSRLRYTAANCVTIWKRLSVNLADFMEGASAPTTFIDSSHLRATISQQTFKSFGGAVKSDVLISVMSPPPTFVAFMLDSR